MAIKIRISKGRQKLQTSEIVTTVHNNTLIRSLHVLAKVRTRTQQTMSDRSVFTARCYASAVLAMALCPSQVGVLLKRLNVGSHKQHHTIAQGL